VTTHHVLNLGAGVQSTTVYLLAREGFRVTPRQTLFAAEEAYDLKVDWAVFADTQEEPAPVYRHLEWLRSLNDPPILVVTSGKLGDDLITGVPVKNQREGKTHAYRFASIPAYTGPDHRTRPPGKVKEGKVQRQCTQDYKIIPIEKAIRYQILGLNPRQHIPKDVRVIHYFGLSAEEGRRVKRVKERFAKVKWAEPRFPLYDLGWSRKDCLAWLDGRVPHPVPRSACTFCPYRTNQEWALLKATDPEGWERAVEIDRVIREDGSQAGPGLAHKLYLHRSCIPLDMVDLGVPSMLDGFTTNECLGMCGV
jgi:hypothetical protein